MSKHITLDKNIDVTKNSPDIIILDDDETLKNELNTIKTISFPIKKLGNKFDLVFDSFFSQ